VLKVDYIICHKGFPSPSLLGVQTKKSISKTKKWGVLTKLIENAWY